LHETVLSLCRQSLRADEILLSVVDPERDVLPETLKLKGVRVVSGPKGSSCQRNTALDRVHPDCDLVTFFDDDVELHSHYLRNCCEFMAQHPDVVMMSGGFLANGASTGEISRSEAVRIVQSCSEPSGDARPRAHLPGTMTVRRKVAQEVRFDERLRWYAVYEDYDFSVRCAKFGPLMNVPTCQMVHLATQTSRSSAKRVGYSCLMNGFYLWRKGSQTMWGFLGTTLKVIFANVLGVVVVRHGASRAQRCEQLYGVVLGFRDVLLHGAQPELVERI
jgi:hypothetical protein